MTKVTVSPSSHKVKVNQYRSRYFLFSKTNPSTTDYEHLVRECGRIDAAFAFRTTSSSGAKRLVGFIILRGHRTVEDDLGRCFPNFLLTQSPYNDDFDTANMDVIAGSHPFNVLKRKLFS